MKEEEFVYIQKIILKCNIPDTFSCFNIFPGKTKMFQDSQIPFQIYKFYFKSSEIGSEKQLLNMNCSEFIVFAGICLPEGSKSVKIKNLNVTSPVTPQCHFQLFSHRHVSHFRKAPVIRDLTESLESEKCESRFLPKSPR